MKPINKIIFATDLWHDSQDILDYTKYLQSKFDANLWIVHALDSKHYYSYSAFVPFGPEVGLSEYLDTIKVEINKNLINLSEKIGCPNKPVLLEGNPRQSLIEFAKQNQADLILMGASSSRIPLLTLGSVTDYVVRHAPCPVFIVRKT